MNPLSNRTPQAEQETAHDNATVTSPDTYPAPAVPVMPAVREVAVQQPMLPALSPLAPLRTGQNTAPVLAVGMKRSAADAGLEADAVPDGKRAKTSHATGSDPQQRQEAPPETPDPVINRKRNALDAGLGEGDLPPTKRLRHDEPHSQDVHNQVMLDCKPLEGKDPAQDKSAAACLAGPRWWVNSQDWKILGSLYIWDATAQGDFQTMQAWLEKPGIDVNATYGPLGTLLHAAAKSGSLEITQALLAMPGIDLNAVDIDGSTALAIAKQQNAPSIVEALLAAQGFNVSFQEFMDRHREFAAAIKVGNIAMAQSLLADSPWIDINFKLSYKSVFGGTIDKTVLDVAIENSHPEVVHFLLAMPGIAVDQNDVRHLCTFAAEKGHLRLLQLMMDRPDFNGNCLAYSYSSYLILAAENGHFPIVRALLAVPGIDINVGATEGRTALLRAAKNNHQQIAVVLAAMPGINVHARIKDDFSYRGYFSYCDCTAFMVAADKGNLPLLRTLLTAEAINVNLKNDRGYTALMLAAVRGHLEIVRALLAVPGIDIEAWSDRYPSEGGYVDHYDKNGSSISWTHGEYYQRPLFSALSLAKTTGKTQIVEALLAMPVSREFVHRKLVEQLSGGSYLSSLKSGKKSIPTPEETYRFLRQTLYPGSAANSTSVSPPPQPEQLDPQRASWLEQKCIALSLGTCRASDVPFLLQSTLPLPAWCQSSLANAIALGFTAGHYRNAPDLVWQAVQQTRAWLASLAFGARPSRQDAIELDPGICYQLESMHLWQGFLNALEQLRPLKADPDGCVTDKLTLLGRAARDGDLPMIKVLVALGANIHLRSPNGDVPIVAAARAGQWAACAELFSLGAMPVMGDNKGYSALYYIASAFAHLDTATPALAKLIRYLRLKNVRFNIPAPNPDERDREKNPTVLVSDILVGNRESWILYGKAIYGIDDEPTPALATAPAAPVHQSMALKTDVHAMFQSANAEAPLAAWLDEDPQRVHWQDPDDGQGLLHLAAAHRHIGLVRLLLDRGITRTHADHSGQTAVQLLPADYMSSYTPAAKDIAELLR